MKFTLKKKIWFVLIGTVGFFVLAAICALGYVGTKEYQFKQSMSLNNWDRVKSLLEKGVNPNIKNSYGYTALHLACYDNTEDAVVFLVNLNADVNAQTNSGASCLHIAAKNGNTKILDILLENGGDIELSDKGNETPLFVAVRHGQLAAVDRFLKSNANVNQMGKHGWTPLHVGLRSNHINKASVRLEIVSELIKYGADVNASNNDGFTWDSEHDSSPSGRRGNLPNQGGNPLDIAISNGFTEIAELLHSSGAVMGVGGRN